MANDKEIEQAVLAERDRCTALLEAYREMFESSTDKWMGNLWCRIRNQIANGAKPEEADLAVQLNLDEEDEFEDDELDDEFEEDDDEWHLEGGDHYPPPCQN